MIELLRECRDALGNIHTYAHKTDFVLKESSDMLKRLDAALAGKDAEQNAAPQGGDTLPATEPAKRVKGNVAPSQPVEAGPAGAAPGLPEEPNDVTTARRADAEVGWAT